jgi:hypothetical protein
MELIEAQPGDVLALPLPEGWSTDMVRTYCEKTQEILNIRVAVLPGLKSPMVLRVPLSEPAPLKRWSYGLGA